MTEEKQWDDMDPKQLTILSKWFWGVVIVVVAIFLWSLPRVAWADDVPVHVFEDDAVRLQLFAAPCEDETAKQVAANSPLKDLPLKKASSAWVVQTPMGAFRIEYAGCWVEFNYRGKDGYAVAFEDKEIRFFPAEGFKKTKRQIGI
jgi:hypothetical protein